MTLHVRLLFVAVSVSVVIALLAGCGGSTGQVPSSGVTGAQFVGSAACRGCHTAAYAEWHESGHPYKLSKIVRGQPASFPFSVVPNPPAGWSWSDVSYQIGGYAWKARWMDKNGYIITGDDVQYNLATGGFSAYHSSDPLGTKPYDCGKCHTTGWVATGPDGPHQDGLPGIYGTFTETGIGCEACHGPGSKHVMTGSRTEIIVDRSSELCGRCHTRDAQRRVEASGGFIRHHEQYDEMISAGHRGLLCLDCHDNHEGSVYQGAITRECGSCHTDKPAHINHPAGPDCIDCHMSHAAKSAVKDNDYMGDVRSHIVKINHDAVGKDAMWYSVGGKQFANGAVTLDFACYGCHTDSSGVGGGGSMKTLEELSDRAKTMHQ